MVDLYWRAALVTGYIIIRWEKYGHKLSSKSSTYALLDDAWTNFIFQQREELMISCLFGSFTIVWSSFLRINVKCGASLCSNILQSFTFYSSGYNPVPLCTVWSNNAAFRDTQSLQGIFYSLFIFSWSVAPATNTGRHTVALRDLLYKDCLLLKCEKADSCERREKLPSSWRALTEFPHEELKWSQTGRKFNWWMFCSFVLSHDED